VNPYQSDTLFNAAAGLAFRQLFDELVTTAASHSILRYRFISRYVGRLICIKVAHVPYFSVTATKTTEYYVVDHKQIHPRHDLPLTCPESPILSSYLSQSQNFERSLFGAVNPAHEPAFYNQVKENMFCSMNMRQILVSPSHHSTPYFVLTTQQQRQREWRTFFRHLTEKSAKRIREGSKEEYSFGFNIYRYLRMRFR
jgi:hypothetical protein